FIERKVNENDVWRKGTKSRYRGSSGDTEGRQFQEKLTEEFFFTLHNGKPICLLCNEYISVMKEFNIKRHYSTKHPMLLSLTGQIGKHKIQKLTANLEKQQQMFHKQRTQHDNFVKASFIVTSKLAKSLKPSIEGGFIKECMFEVCSVLCPEKKNKFGKITNSITDLSETAELINIIIYSVDEEFPVTEELLVLQALKGTTTGENIFNEVKK
ncbi:general transcription factor II-I repeat domain-containing protein 2-like, partial [Halyomorpha halys]|uniref:general transcription factor II-I repeat domain-containing protein 2-like n=1 Tax=Halyomorpha halys TaxID=286706 RepID=UPI0034D36882